MDIVSISAGIQSLKAAIDIAKDVKDSAQTLERAELQLKLSDLMIKLADVNSQLASIQIERDDQKQEIEELKKKLRNRAEVVFRKGVYWFNEEECNLGNGPFCTRCFDAEDRLMNLKFLGRSETKNYQCPDCQTVYHL